jgi:hypothetical protein
MIFASLMIIRNVPLPASQVRYRHQKGLYTQARGATRGCVLQHGIQRDERKSKMFLPIY